MKGLLTLYSIHTAEIGVIERTRGGEWQVPSLFVFFLFFFFERGSGVVISIMEVSIYRKVDCIIR